MAAETDIGAPLTLMLARVMNGAANADDDSYDEQILTNARRTTQAILTEADIVLNELEDRGWKAPEDVVDYAARLLFLCPDLDALVEAVRVAQGVHVARGTSMTGGAA